MTASSIIPESEKLKRAIRWISAEIGQGRENELPEIINEALFQFDLTPNDSAFLYRFYKIDQKRNNG